MDETEANPESRPQPKAPDEPLAFASEAPVETGIEADAPASPQQEYGGPSGPEPTRYGDWERKGRCIDF